MHRLPLDVPVALHLTPRALFAITDLLTDPDVFDTLEARFAAGGLVEDACEDAAEAVAAQIRRALDAAASRPQHRVKPRVQLRPVTASGTLVLGGVVYAHRDLEALAGDHVVCRPVVVDGELLCRVELTNGTVVCVAAAVRRTGGRALAA